jgi:hypothetical protein
MRVVFLSCSSPHPDLFVITILFCSQVSVQLGDLCDEETIRKLVDPDGCTHVTTIHLAALLSGYAEDNFDLGMKVGVLRVTHPPIHPRIITCKQTQYWLRILHLHPHTPHMQVVSTQAIALAHQLVGFYDVNNHANSDHHFGDFSLCL